MFEAICSVLHPRCYLRLLLEETNSVGHNIMENMESLSTSFSPSLCLFLFVCLPACLSVCLSVCASLSLFLSPSLCLCVFLSRSFTPPLSRSPSPLFLYLRARMCVCVRVGAFVWGMKALTNLVLLIFRLLLRESQIRGRKVTAMSLSTSLT